MSIWHSLNFNSQRTAEEVLKLLLSNNIGLNAGTYDQMKGEGLFGRISEISLDIQEDLVEDYNVQVNARATFDQNSDEDVDEGLKIIGKAVALLLNEEKGDAIFFYVADTPILKRINSRMKVINENGFEWLTSAIDKAGLRYELEAEELVRAA